MSSVGAVWMAVLAVCGGVAMAEETQTAAAWWRAAGEDLVRAWARQEETKTVTLLLLADGDVREAAAWADTVRIFASHLAISEDPLVCVVASLPSLPLWRPDSRTLLVAPLFSQHHAQALSQMIRSAGHQARHWLLLAGPRYDHLLATMFLPYNNQVVVAQPGQVVQLWDQYQTAPGLERHLHLRATWTPRGDRVSAASSVEGGTIELLPVPPRLPDLTGLHIRCLVEEWPPFIMLHTEGGETQLAGVFFELWTILQGRLNFTFRLLVRQPTSPIGGWSSYSMEFTAGSWAGLLLTACVCCVVLTIVLRLASGEHYAAREAVLIVIGCLCQQGPVREEKRSSVRMVLLTVGVFGVVSVTHYSSVMISFLTLTTSTHAIASLVDLLDSSTYTLGIVRGTSTHDIIQASRGEPYRQVWTKLLAPRPDSFVASIAEGVQRADHEDFVFLIDENFYLSRYARHCSLTLVGPRYLKVPSSYTFRKDLPYKLIFDQEITRMMEVGLLDREIRRRQARAACEAESVTPVGLNNTFTALLLLGTGMLLSLLFLLIERLASRCTDQTVGVQFSLAPHARNSDAGEGFPGPPE
ncbi:uncharacterized protein LOC135105212 isoform X2 [Scylla paramamosain]|uniref:uncharacterized protein LOC135105212 isoform X2 n=1 Tax=Scylla paramamosain TaxID=85552 RepID=UPI003083895E